MAPRVVLVTGVADPLGGRLPARLAAEPRVERVLGVDITPPAANEATRVKFVRADLRGPLRPVASRCRCPEPPVGPPPALVDLTSGHARLLNYGRVIDTTRLRTTFGFTPKWTTAAAVDDYVRAR